MRKTYGREMFISFWYEGEGPVEGEKQMLWYVCISLTQCILYADLLLVR